jgi:hypothetical protein
MDTERLYLIASQLELRHWTFTWSTARMSCSAITTRCRLRGMPMGNWDFNRFLPEKPCQTGLWSNGYY